MKKIKLLNPNKGKNKGSFHVLNIIKDMLPHYGIEIIEHGSYDYLIVGTEDFINKNVPLERSVREGLDFLSNITGEYILIDSSDSTSLVGAYEILAESSAKYLLRNQYLTRDMYRIPAPLGKLWWRNNLEPSDNWISYDIPDTHWKRLKFTGWNLGHWHPKYIYDDITPYQHSSLDISCMVQSIHDENYDFEMRNDDYYTSHRVDILQNVQKLNNYRVMNYRVPFDQYIKILQNTKIGISPHGMGEINYRDFEIVYYGGVLVKPDVTNVKTFPNFFRSNETYYPIDINGENLAEVISDIYHNVNILEHTEHTRKIYREIYQYDHVCQHWADLL